MTDHILDAAVTGLTEREAAERLVREGPNELPSSKPRSPFAIAFEVVREPMFLLLVALRRRLPASWATSRRR